MFTALPLPRGRWEDGLRRHSTACLPLVGLLLGFIWWALSEVGRFFLPGYLSAALMAALPWMLTGFIHLDGYMDTSDAVLSWRDRDARLKILKDVHVGSFAVVMLGLLMLFQYAACMSVVHTQALILLPVLSRCGSAVCVLRLKPLGHSEYANADPVPGVFMVAVVLEAAAALAALAMLCGAPGLLAGIVALVGYAVSMGVCVRMLGGFSGDLAGFSLTVSELCALVALSAV